ncbi:hypothetical protein PILCRDRAFT_7231, partial [Piloderma croceum F 1598]
YSAANAQLLSVPPFAVGGFFTIVVGIYSDKYQIRGPIVAGGAFISLIGYIVLYTQKAAGAGYAGALLAAAGVFPTVAVDLAWVGGNAGGDLKRGVVIAMVVGLGNLGGICSSFIYIDPPHFHIGHGTMQVDVYLSYELLLTTVFAMNRMGWLSLTVILSFFSMWDYNRLNKQKEALCAKEGITNDRADEFQDMGDDSPLFRFCEISAVVYSRTCFYHEILQCAPPSSQGPVKAGHRRHHNIKTAEIAVRRPRIQRPSTSYLQQLEEMEQAGITIGMNVAVALEARDGPKGYEPAPMMKKRGIFGVYLIGDDEE